MQISRIPGIRYVYTLVFVLEDEVLRINREFTRIFGYKTAEIINRPSIDLIVPPHLRTEALRVRERLWNGHHVSMETVRQRKDGSFLDASEVSFPVIVSGKCIAYYVIFRDITRSKRAYEDLQNAQGELAHLSRITTMGELAASIAHEINQPIGAIVTNGDAAVRWLNRGASVTTDLTKRLPPLLGDRVQLQQVMLNLIMNAIDAMSSVSDRPRRVESPVFS